MNKHLHLFLQNSTLLLSFSPQEATCEKQDGQMDRCDWHEGDGIGIGLFILSDPFHHMVMAHVSPGCLKTPWIYCKMDWMNSWEDTNNHQGLYISLSLDEEAL